MVPLERINIYDYDTIRSKKKSGKLLGKITVNGFVPSKLKQKTEKILLNDVVEIGATSFFYNRTKDIRLKLKEFFPENWELLYTISPCN